MSFGEKYQNFLNKINERIPIKAITSKLDKKNPLTSFFIFFILILIILFLVIDPLSLLNGGSIPEYNTLTIKLASSNDEVLSNFDFKIKDILNDEYIYAVTNNRGVYEVDLDKGGEYYLIVEKNGYEYTEEILNPLKNEQKFIINVQDLPDKITRQISFVDTKTQQQINEPLQVTITCSNTDYQVNPNSADVNGSYEFGVPIDCGQLLVNVESEKYSANSVVLSENNNIVNVEEIQTPSPKGNITFEIKSGDNLLSNIKVTIFKEIDPTTPLISEFVYGSKRFKGLDYGNYKAIFRDPQSRYVSNELLFEINSQEKTEEINLQAYQGNEEPGDENSTIEKRTINITLKDQSTGLEITDPLLTPTITIMKDEDTAEDILSYNPEGTSIDLEKDRDYTLTANAEGYLAKTIDIIPLENEYIILLEPITPENSSDILVHIYDEQSIVVKEAYVYVYNSECSFIDPRFSAEITDSNGDVNFVDMPEGDFCFKVFKQTELGQSQIVENRPPEDSNVNIEVYIGQSHINLNVKDRYNEPIPNSTVNALNYLDHLIGTDYTNSSGTYSKDLKADTKAYLKIQKEGYYDYYTTLYSLVANLSINKDVNMVFDSYSSNIPTAQFLGIYNQDNQKVDILTQNSKYLFRFKIINTNQNSFGFKFNIGDSQNVDDGFLYIDEIQSNFETISYFKELDFSNSVSGGQAANSINAYWSDVESGVYEIDIPVKINMATQGSAVPINYRTYNNSSTQSELVQDIFYIDAQSLCNNDFCVSGQYTNEIENLTYDLDQSPITLNINTPYAFNYKITNASSNVFENARFNLKNTDAQGSQETILNLMYYNIIQTNNGSENRFYKSEGVLTGIPDFYNYKIPFAYDEDYLYSDKINVYDNIDISLRVLPENFGNTKLTHTIISDQSTIYDYPESAFDVMVLEESQEATINVSPENILPNTTFPIEVEVLDEDGFPIENAIVNVYVRNLGQDYAIPNSGLLTNSEGTINYTIPGMRIGESLVVKISKPGYYAEEKVIDVENNILKIEANGSEVNENNILEYSIHKTDLEGQTLPITLTNLSNFDLEIQEFNNSDLSFSNSNISLLDLDSTINLLNGQLNSQNQLPVEGTKTLNIKMVVDPQQANNIFETQNFEGSLTLNINQKDNATNIFTFNIPINVKVSVGDGVAEDNCLIITQVANPWKSIIDGSRAINTEFNIVNNCKYKETNEPAILHNLKAKIKNNKDYYGSYQLEISGETGASATLSQGSYTNILSEVGAGRLYNAKLTYIPQGIKRGEVSTDLFINAEIETDEGFQNVNMSEGEKALTTDFEIINLSDCIDYYIDGVQENNMIEIPSDLPIGEHMQVNLKNKCSDLLKFKMYFCQDKQGNRLEGCGNLEIKNINDADNSLTFDIGDDSQTIEIVKPEVPGAYRLTTELHALDNYDSTIMNIQQSMKLNVKDRLYMIDPFIEMAKINDSIYSYQSEPEKLYNNDINTYLPWDYVTQNAIEGHDGFSKFMSDEDLEDPLTRLKLINFQNTEDMANFSAGGNLDSGWWQVGGSLAAGATGFAIAGLFASAHTAASIFLSAIGPWGVGVLALIAVGSFLANTFENDYQFLPEYKFPDVSLEYQNPDLTRNKEIILNNSTTQEQYLNVFDITGAKYMFFLNGHGYAHGKLINDETMKLILPKCNGRDHKNLLYTEEYITKSENCDNDFKDMEITDDQIIYKMKCNGSWPRKGIKLKVDTYMVCAYDEDIWHEQAGIKPLFFKVSNNSIIDQNLNNSGSIFKQFTFYPTLDDSAESVDPLFAGASEINHNGKFRIEFHSKPNILYESPDLDLYDCYTDAGKRGITGPAAVPKVDLDWQWKDIDQINRCQDNYCDAVQLNIEILNRINKAKEFLDQKYEEGKIHCPYSNQQVIENEMDGSYMVDTPQTTITNNIDPASVGINSVNMYTDGNLFKVKVTIENRTPNSTTGNVAINLGSYTPTKVEKLSCPLGLGNCPPDMAFDWSEEDYSQSGNTLSISPVNTNTIIFTYGEESNPVIGNNLYLGINYSGEATKPQISNVATDINLGIFENTQDMSSCQVPATTALLNNTSYIDKWFNHNIYPDNVSENNSWTNEEINTFKNILNFDAKLITDTYNQNLINAFDKAYGGKASKNQGIQVNESSFLSVPSQFTDPTTGYLSDIFKNNFMYSQKYSSDEQVNISTPGTYKIRIDFVFNNEEWKIIDSTTNQVDVNTFILFDKIKSPEQESAFYRLPFDGFLGLEDNSYTRMNYGLGYLGDNIIITEDETFGNLLKTYSSSGSSPYKFLRVTKKDDFSYINSDISTRGNILKIDNSGSNPEMIFSPNAAIPVLLNINRNINLPFSIYYSLKNRDGQPIYGSNNLTYWSGVGNYRDFSGDLVYQKYQRYSDRASRVAENKPMSYALDWTNVSKKGNVNLRTIFYIPFLETGKDQIYTLSAKTRGNDPSIDFYTQSALHKDIELNTITTDSSIKRLTQLLGLIKNKKVCVTNSEDGSISEFWWNPAAIYPENSVFTGDQDSLETLGISGIPN